MESQTSCTQTSAGGASQSGAIETVESSLADQWRAWILAFILTTTFLVSLGSLPKEFTNWDDEKYVVNNPLIRSFSWGKLNRILTEPYFVNFAPVTLISYGIDYQLWKFNATGYHFHNLAIHLGCVLILFLVLQAMGLPGSIVLVTAGLFAIHPTNAESVNWASERKNLLASFFFLLSFYHYIRHSETRRRANYLSSLLFFLLSILSKATTVIGPLVFLAYECLWKRKGFTQLCLYDKLPFLIFSEIVAFFSIHAADSGAALVSYHQAGPLVSLAGVGYLCLRYLKLLFWPTSLTPVMYGSLPSLSEGDLWCSLVLCVFSAWAMSRWCWKYFFWLTFFFIFLIPVMNLVPLPVMMANRYLYLPQIGIWILASSGTALCLERLKSRGLARLLLSCLISGWAIFLVVLSYQESRKWRNSETLWSNAIAENFSDIVAHNNLGAWLANQGQAGRSGCEFFIASRLKPDYHRALVGLANYYLTKGRFDLARQLFCSAIDLVPKDEVAISGLGKLFFEQRQTQKALHTYFRVLHINPANQEALNNAAVISMQLNRWDSAYHLSQQMIERLPDDVPDGYFRMGQVLSASGNLSGAVRAWEQAKQKPHTDSEMRRFIETNIAIARELLDKQ